MHDNDPGPHFAPLFTFLESVVARREYDNVRIGELVAQGVRSTRAAGLPPERVLGFLRRRLHEAPLAAVGDWYRGVLADRIVGIAVDAYATEPELPGDIAP